MVIVTPVVITTAVVTAVVIATAVVNVKVVVDIAVTGTTIAVTASAPRAVPRAKTAESTESTAVLVPVELVVLVQLQHVGLVAAHGQVIAEAVAVNDIGVLLNITDLLLDRAAALAQFVGQELLALELLVFGVGELVG